jgi:hypothetical protein
MTNDQKELAEAVYYTLQVLKKQHELLSRLMLDSEALAASVDHFERHAPGTGARFLKEREHVKSGRTAQLNTETAKVFDALIERLEQAFDFLKN